MISNSNKYLKSANNISTGKFGTGLATLGYYVDMYKIELESFDKVKRGEGSPSGQITYNVVMSIDKNPFSYGGLLNAATSIVDISGNAYLYMAGSEERLNATGVKDKIIESFCDPVVRQNRLKREVSRLQKQNLLDCAIDRAKCAAKMTWIEHTVWNFDNFLKD